MQITPESLPASRRRFTVALTSDETEKYFEQALKHLGHHLKVAGFREGKAPDSIVRQRLKPEDWREEAYSLAVKDAWQKIIKESKDMPIEDPAVEVVKFEADKEAKLTFTFDIRPVVKVDNWQKIKIKPEKVTDNFQEKVDQILQSILDNKAKTVAKLTSAELGDQIVVTFSGELNHVKQDKLSADKFPVILGQSQTIPGFEDQLIGLKKGQEKSFNLEFPKNHFDQELAEKTITFSVKINEVFERILPKLDNALAKEFGYENYAEMVKVVEADVKKQQEADLFTHQKADWLSQFEKKITTDLPASLLKVEVDRSRAQWRAFLEERHLPAEDWLKMRKTTLAELEKNWQQSAEASVRIGLGLATVAAELDRHLHSNDDFQKLLDELVTKATQAEKKTT